MNSRRIHNLSHQRWLLIVFLSSMIAMPLLSVDAETGPTTEKKEGEGEDDDGSFFPDTSDLKTNFYNAKSEEAFKKLYPNLDTLEPWPLAENLTEEFLKHLCINVLLDVYPSHVPTVRIVREYRAPGPAELPTRVMRHTPVEFKEGIKKMTLIRCVSKDFHFFVGRGDDEYVFKLEKDEKSDSYFFMSGPHAINFKDELK